MPRFVCFLAIAFLIWPIQHTAAQVTADHKAIKLDAATYDSYVGRYELTPDFVITIRREANGLSLQATDQPKFEIYAETPTKFFLTVVDAQITFVKNEKGEVTHLILHQNGVDQVAKRIVAATSKVPAATPTAAPAPLNLPFDINVPFAPIPFRADGRSHLAYEIHITNFSPAELKLESIEVTGNGGRAIAKYEGEELASLLGRPGIPQASDKQRIGGGLRAVAYIWLTFDSPSAIPQVLAHNFTARSGQTSENPGNELKGSSGEVKASDQQTMVVSPPLRGDGWLAANGPSNVSGHRRAVIPVDGAAQISQRFAIDWVRLRDDGKTWTGDQLKNENYRAYGADALAVADGTVVAVKDGIPENIPGAASRAVPITLETVGGNHVILDIGQGKFAFYAHLQPGSLRVKLGEKVKRGQVLGLVGNSGNSTEPHLHFHLSNRNSPLGSEGIPYVLDAFELQGKGWGWKSTGAPVEKRRLELPMQDEVVKLGDNK